MSGTYPRQEAMHAEVNQLTRSVARLQAEKELAQNLLIEVLRYQGDGGHMPPALVEKIIRALVGVQAIRETADEMTAALADVMVPG
jgi:hypothetical protein